MGIWSIIESSELDKRGRLDAEYFQPRNLEYERVLDRLTCVTLGSLGLVTDGIHASPDVVEEDGMRYLSAKCVKDNEFALGDTLQISHKQDAENIRTRLRQDDLLLTTVGTIGNAAVVQRELLPANIDRHLGLIRIRADATVDPYFAATFLNSDFGRFQSLHEATGNVQLNLFIEKIKTLRIPILPNAAKISHATRKAYQLRRDAQQLISTAEQQLATAVGLAHLDTTPALIYERNYEDLETAQRFGAEYFMPCKQRALDGLAAKPGKPLSAHCESVRQMFAPAGARRGELVRNFDLTDALEPVLDDSMAPVPGAEIGSVKKRFQAGDIVISRLRAYLRQIALVRTPSDVHAVGSSEFIVLRPRLTGDGALMPETLLIFLRSLPVQTILKWSQDGSQHPRFTEADLLAIPVPNAVLTAAPRIDALVHQAMAARAEARSLLEKSRADVERQIRGSSG